MGRLDAQVVAILEECLRERVGELDEPLAGLASRPDRAIVHVGEIHDLENLVSGLLEPAAQQIFEQERAEVADVRVVPDGRPAGVQRDARRGQRLQRLDPARERVVEGQRRLHGGETY